MTGKPLDPSYALNWVGRIRGGCQQMVVVNGQRKVMIVVDLFSGLESWQVGLWRSRS